MSDNKVLDNYFEERVEQNQFSGVVLVTRTGRSLYHRAFGVASQAWQIPNALNTRFDTASITKLFTAVATLQLIDKGEFRFDTSVTDYLGLEGTAISKEVNVFQLLTHSSGIGDDCEEENGEIYEELFRTKPNYSIQNTADFLPQFVNKPPNFPPGQGTRYCNCSFVLLGLMIEQATGMTYRDYVANHIFAKAHMADSEFCRMDRVHANVAEGCDPIFDVTEEVIGWKRNIYSYPPIGSPDGGGHVTAKDLDRFLRSVQAGDLLSPELTEKFFSPHLMGKQVDDWSLHYGFGLEFHIAQNGEIICFEKEGINAGVSGVMRYFPNSDTNVIILSNMEDGVWEPIWKIHEMVLDGSL